MEGGNQNPIFAPTVPRITTGSPIVMVVSVQLVRAFVQRDGSSGNGAGIVLLPGIRRNKLPTNINTNTNININNALSFCEHELRVDEALFPPEGVCLRIAKRVDLPETSFVVFPSPTIEDGHTNENCNDGIIIGIDSANRPENKIRAGDEKNNDNNNNNNNNNIDNLADFVVKWYTPEQEVDLCGHATVALAGYLYSMVAPRNNSDGSIQSKRGNCFWKMKCNAGVLGIEVSEVVPSADVSDNSYRKQVDSPHHTNTDAADAVPLARVVMEQANPEYCGNVSHKEVASSLGIDGKTDLAVAVVNDNSDGGVHPSDNNRLPFPFRNCEIVSTGGRDLMIPVRSTVLNEMEILGKNNNNNNGNSTNGNEKRELLCDNINIVSKRYDLVGYHMFEVDDALFDCNDGSDGNGEANYDVMPNLNKVNRDQKSMSVGCSKGRTSSMHLNELVRIFQIGEKEGGLGAERCLQAVLRRDVPDRDRCNNGDTNDSRPDGDIQNDSSIDATATSFARQSRTIRVTGVRNFAPYVGVPEEPATGSANGALACYLVKSLFLGACCRDEYTKDVCFCFCFRMEQGRAMGEPCLIDAEIEVMNGTIATVKVGGLAKVTGDSLELDLTCL
eukprot:jgi/Psemu1/33826/gm1.33826_g